MMYALVWIVHKRSQLFSTGSWKLFGNRTQELLKEDALRPAFGGN
jgi:hypothetical protein